jgi:hypothetical protein
MKHVWGRDEIVQGFGVKTEGKRPLGSPRSRWEDDIIMDFKETGWKCMDYMWLRIGTGAALL